MTSARGIPAQGTRKPYRLLWAAYLAPPLGWFGQLNLSFLVAAYACTTGRIWLLNLFSALVFAVAAAGTWCGWLSLRAYPEPKSGSRFLAWMALILGLVYLMSIGANVMPNFLMEPCR